ncbi:MAG: DUF4040 domain-containing protein [Parvularculales bacterium]
MPLLIDIALFALLLITALAIVRTRNLFTVTMLTGTYSLLVALLLLSLDAADVAFTEAAVGAGISTILMLAAIALTVHREKQPQRFPLAALVIVTVLGAALIYGSLDIPAFGDPNAPAQLHVGADYIAHTPDDIAIPNLVTAVLASYRGYDTLGEVVVIFTAGIGVIMLLGQKRRPERHHSPTSPDVDTGDA